MFKTVYTAHEAHKKFTEAGLPERPDYKPKYLDSGAYELVEDGVIHSLDDIQAWLPTCDMGVIMKQYLRTGDESLLNRRAGFYADVVDVPKDYVALRNMLNDADQIFASLPLELRERFGHSPSRFYADGVQADAIIQEFVASEKLKAELSKPIEVPSVDVPSVEKGGVVSES